MKTTIIRLKGSLFLTNLSLTKPPIKDPKKHYKIFETRNFNCKKHFVCKPVRPPTIGIHER